MHALHSRHFDIGRRAGAGDERRQCRWRRAAREILRQRLHNLVHPQNAQVPVRQQGENAAAFRGGMVQHDRPRVGDSCRSGGDDTIALLDVAISKFAIDFPLELQRDPLGGKSRRRGEDFFAAVCQAIIDAGSNSALSTFDNVGVVFT